MARILQYAVAILFLTTASTLALYKHERERADDMEAAYETQKAEAKQCKQQAVDAAKRSAERAAQAIKDRTNDVETLKKAPRDSSGRIVCDAKCLRDRFER